MDSSSWVALLLFAGGLIAVIAPGLLSIRATLRRADFRFGNLIPAIRGAIARVRERGRLRRAARLQMLSRTNLDAMSPIGFEHHCADVLRCQGWLCEVTPPSADFGVDVIAKRPGAKVAIQVKKWTAAVNLSAVQEVAAGRAHFGAQHAAVVSVSGYLPSAVELATSNRVMLLAYEDLFDFTRQVGAAWR